MNASFVTDRGRWDFDTTRAPYCNPFQLHQHHPPCHRTGVRIPIRLVIFSSSALSSSSIQEAPSGPASDTCRQRSTQAASFPRAYARSFLLPPCLSLSTEYHTSTAQHRIMYQCVAPCLQACGVGEDFVPNPDDPSVKAEWISTFCG